MTQTIEETLNMLREMDQDLENNLSLQINIPKVVVMFVD